MQHEPSYKIGLPSSIRFKSQLIFGILLFLFLSISASGVYAGIKTGKFSELLIKPVENFVKLLESRADDMNAKIDEYPSFTATSSSSIDIKINTNKGNNSTGKSSDKAFDNYNPTPYPTIKYKSYEDSKQEQDAWWTQVQEDNKKKAEQSAKELEEFKANSQKEMEEFEKEAQQGMEEFKEKYEF